MKPLRSKIALWFLLAVVVVEEVLRHLTAGSSIIASLLSARTAGLHWDVMVAVTFVGCRLLAVWLLPALLVTWSLARLWKRR